MIVLKEAVDQRSRQSSQAPREGLCGRKGTAQADMVQAEEGGGRTGPGCSPGTAAHSLLNRKQVISPKTSAVCPPVRGEWRNL